MSRPGGPGSSPGSGVAYARGMSLFIPEPSPEEIPGPIREPLDLALGDLQGSRPIELRVGFERRPDINLPGEWDSVLWFLEPGGSGSGFGWFGETGAELAVKIADYLQEQVFPESRQAWGEARPPCPGHGHPAAPALVDGEAWWLCPATGGALGRLGSLRGGPAAPGG